MALDHSLTYTRWRLKNVPHKIRLRAILRQTTAVFESSGCMTHSYADFGCSNGYVTSKIAAILRPQYAVGYDHTEDNLSIARRRYSGIDFSSIDLNTPCVLDRKFDVVTCFETLEHVGDVGAAVSTLVGSMSQRGTALIVVPIEHGLIGTLKFVIKLAYGYNLNELSVRGKKVRVRQYVGALLTGKRMSEFRDSARAGWGTHFGFDYRDVSDSLSKHPVFVKRYRIGFNMFYRVTKS